MNTELIEQFAKKLNTLQLQIDAIAADTRAAHVPVATDNTVDLLKVQISHLAAQVKAMAEELAAKADASTVSAGDRRTVEVIAAAVAGKLNDVKKGSADYADVRIGATVGEISRDVAAVKGITAAHIEHARDLLLARADRICA